MGSIKFRAMDPTGLVEALKYRDRLSAVWGIATIRTLGSLWGSGSGPLGNPAMQDNNYSSHIMTNPKNLKEEVLHL